MYRGVWLSGGVEDEGRELNEGEKERNGRGKCGKMTKLWKEATYKETREGN